MTVDYHIVMQKIFAKGYLGRKMSDEEFRPAYNEWWMSFICEEVDDELKMVFRYKRPFGDFRSG